MMMLRVWLLCLLCLPAGALWAETLVLMQGYQAKGVDWRDAGITETLIAAGWADGGHLRSPQGALKEQAGRRFFTLKLSSEAPLMYQLRELTGYLQRIRQDRPQQSLILVGHSAGGVLGRLYMVRQPQSGVAALITFASPHLGTESAEVGLKLGQGLLGWASSLLGREDDLLGRSQGLFADLVRERPGSMLFWLNRQPHPQSRYISVVRDDRLSWFGDLVVPVWSQDMNRVQALMGRAVSIPSTGNHGLERQDGELLVQILRRLRST